MADQNKLSEALRKLVQAPENNLQIVHGFVAKINSNNTVDVISMDGTIHLSEVQLNSIPGLSKGIMHKPTLKSDVTVLWLVGTGDAAILSFSHLDTHNIITTKETSIGVTGEVENPEVDYNELSDDGNKTETKYTSSSIVSRVSNKSHTASQTIISTKISTETGNALIEQENNQIKHSVENSSQTLTPRGITLDGQQISLGSNATEPAVLGTQLVTLMMKFMTECSKITTPTMLGTMPIINLANFLSFLSECNSFLSQTVTVK